MQKKHVKLMKLHTIPEPALPEIKGNIFNYDNITHQAKIGGVVQGL